VTLVAAVPQAELLRGSATALSTAPATLQSTLDTLNNSLEATAVGSIITVTAVEIVTAMLVLAVSGAVLGQRMTPGEAWRRVRGRVLAVLVLAILQTLLLIVAALLPILPGVIVGLSGAPVVGVVLGIIGFVGGIVLVLFLGTRLAFSAPALLLEEQDVFAAMGRSWRLVRGSFWRVLGISLLAELLVGVGSTLIEVPFGVVSAIIQAASGPDQLYRDFWTNLVQLLVSGVGQVVAGAVFYPFAAAVTTLLYIDVRMRREGLDVELLRAAEASPGT
jgi:Membrane domain of glycerophosphoryl diester phosphodiesterase